MEANRSGEPNFQLWEPFIWEFSSAIATMVLLPACIWLLKNHTFDWEKVKTFFTIYLLSSVIFSIAHVVIMVAIRECVYWSQTLDYNFGNIGVEFFMNSVKTYGVSFLF